MTTLWSILSVAGVMILAWISRERAAILSFGILWFFGGHLLESTFLPIELYFEHRNYLPMLGIIMPASYYAVHVIGKARVPTRSLYAGYVALLAWMCFSNAQLWGNTVQLAHVWTEEHYTSKRAVSDMVKLQTLSGNEDRARDYLLDVARMHPDLASVPLFELLNFGCDETTAPVIDEEFVKRARTASFDLGVISAIQQLNTRLVKSKCPALPVSLYVQVAEAFAENENYLGYGKGRTILYESIARIYVKERDLDGAITYLGKAYQASPRYSLPLQQATLLASAGLYDDAERYLALARSTNPSNRLKSIRQQGEVDKVELNIARMRDHSRGQ